MDVQEFSKHFDRVLFVLVLAVCVELLFYLFMPEFVHAHHGFFHMVDVVVLIAFSLEVLLRYFEYHDLKKFLKEHWLSVLALFLALGAARVLRAIRLSSILMEEESVLTSMLPRGSRVVEMPIILGKVGKIGAYAQRRRRIKHILSLHNVRSNTISPFYNPLELKELRDSVLE